MAEMNLRDILNEDLNYVRSNPDIDPNSAAEMALKLSATVSTLLDHVADLRQKAYGVMAMGIESDMTIGKAEAHLKASNEYRAYKEAEGYYIGVIEVIRSLRGKARAAEQELKENIT